MKSFITALVCIFTSCAPLANANEPAPFLLGEVLVTGSAELNHALVTDSIDLETLRLHNRETVGRAVSMSPGVTLSKVGSRNEQMVFVRGFDLRQVPVFIDGIPVYVPFDGYVDLGRFITFDLSRIDVSKAFSSLMYGPNTLGGAINLISRRPALGYSGELGGGSTFDDGGHNVAYRSYSTLLSHPAMVCARQWIHSR